MDKQYYFSCISIRLFILGFCIINPAFAHYPHDTHTFIELSPDYANDQTAFIASKQASSTRPVTPLVSRNAGATWEFNARGMDNISNITSASASPLYDVDKKVILTSDGQGVYRSVDAGLSWEKFNNGLPNLRLHDSAAVIDALGDVLYFTTSSGGGLYRRSQQDVAWTLQLDSTILVTAFTASPDFESDQTLLAGGPTGLMYLSTDAGETFNQIGLLAGTGLIYQISFAPDYAISGEVFIGTNTGLYVSKDHLTSVTAVEGFSNEWISALALSPDYRNDGTLFVTTPTQAVFKSTDRGLNWQLHDIGVELTAQSSFHFRELRLSNNFKNDGTVFLASFQGLFRSTDFGITWVELETRPPTLIMDVALSPDFNQDSLMLVSTYGGGLYITEDAGTNWRVSTKGISSPYTYKVAITRGNGTAPILLASHQNHLLISEDKGASWVEKEIANILPKGCIASNMGASPDFANDNTVYLGCRRDGIVVTHDAGETWSLTLNASQLSGGSITSIALSPDYSIDKMLMFSDQRGYFGKSLDEGLNWQLTQNGLPTPGKWYGGRGVVYSPGFSNDRVITAETEEGFHITFDDAITWFSLPDDSIPVARGVIENIAISPNLINDKTALTSVRGEGLFRSDNNVLTWQQIAMVDSGYRYDLQGIVFSPNYANDGLIIGYGHDQLFRSTSNGDTFEPINIPFVRHEDSRRQSVLHKGSWLNVSNSMASGTSFMASATAGNEVSMMFTGTGVRWIGVLADVLGIAEVYLDDVLVATVDQYSATPAWLQTLYEVDNLPLTTHKIRVVATGTKNPSALANWTVVDAFDVIR